MQAGPVVGEFEQPAHPPGCQRVIDPGASFSLPRLSPQQPVFLQGMEQRINHPLFRGDHLASRGGNRSYDFIALHLLVLK